MIIIERAQLLLQIEIFLPKTPLYGETSNRPGQLLSRTKFG